jgi:hypothetical protein
VSDPDPSPVPEDVRARVQARADAAHGQLDATIARRRRVHDRLASSTDPDDQAIARTYLDFLRQAEEVRRSGAALTLAAGPAGDPVVGRMAVFDDDRDVSLVSWHSPAGQRQLLADDRLLVSERPDGTLRLHTLTADDAALAGRIRAQMRVSARRDAMSDPLATLTVEQAAVLRAITDAPGDVVLHGPPGSGKSAIVMVELARRVLSDPAPGRFAALFVTGTSRLARRAESLGRLLGTASITPVPQDDLLAFLSITDHRTPAAAPGLADGGLRLPQSVERLAADLRARLHADVDVPHPLGPVEADEVDAVRRWRARDASTSYLEVADGLAADLRDEYERIIPGARSLEAADAAAELLRPRLTPSDLVDRALDGDRLARPLRTAELLTRPGGRPRRRWDLVVVDEYQRLPGVVLWLLQRWTTRLVLSGDPMQSFAGDDVTTDLASTAQVVGLRTSLRMPDAIARWVDDRWHRAGLPAPAVRSAVGGGHVGTVPPGTPLPAEAQVIGPASRVDHDPDWLTPAEAVGLEWPEVVLLDPDTILADHGPAGLFIAATRAIDRLHLAP